MCGIIGSFDINTIAELVEGNQYRGNFSWSISTIDVNTMKYKLVDKGFGDFEYQSLCKVDEEDKYIICHVQAPTGGQVKDEERIHPARIAWQVDPTGIEIVNMYLWHNGILKRKFLEGIKVGDEVWDTRLLLNYLKDKDIAEGLADIDGAMAGILIKDRQYFYAFRNTTSILYHDDDLNISSVPFKGSKMLEHNTIYDFDLKNRTINKDKTFDNINDAYYFVKEKN